MSEIFVVSLHRCATQSTELFLRRAGFRTCHWPAIVNGVDYQSKVIGAECSPREIVYILKPVFDSFEAFDDVPLPVLYAELDADYPNSRFIAIPAIGYVRYGATAIPGRSILTNEHNIGAICPASQSRSTPSPTLCYEGYIHNIMKTSLCIFASARISYGLSCAIQQLA